MHYWPAGWASVWSKNANHSTNEKAPARGLCHSAELLPFTGFYSCETVKTGVHRHFVINSPVCLPPCSETDVKYRQCHGVRKRSQARKAWVPTPLEMLRGGWFYLEHLPVFKLQPLGGTSAAVTVLGKGLPNRTWTARARHSIASPLCFWGSKDKRDATVT